VVAAGQGQLRAAHVATHRQPALQELDAAQDEQVGHLVVAMLALADPGEQVGREAELDHAEASSAAPTPRR
jgi:hypothetical protein